MVARILVVDDDLDTLNLLKLILENAGYTALLARSGQEALVLLREHPDLVLCDVLMPPPNGYETLRAIRNDPQYCRLPVLMVSALGQDRDVNLALEAGADGYIIKPFRLRALLNAIRQHLPVTVRVR